MKKTLKTLMLIGAIALGMNFAGVKAQAVEETMVVATTVTEETTTDRKPLQRWKNQLRSSLLLRNQQRNLTWTQKEQKLKKVAMLRNQFMHII